MQVHRRMRGDEETFLPWAPLGCLGSDLPARRWDTKAAQRSSPAHPLSMLLPRGARDFLIMGATIAGIFCAVPKERRLSIHNITWATLLCPR